MKNCPYCGRQIEDEAEFCLYCMTPLVDKKKINPLTPKRHRVEIILLIIFMLLAAGLALFAVFGDKRQDTGAPTESVYTENESGDFGSADSPSTDTQSGDATSSSLASGGADKEPASSAPSPSGGVSSGGIAALFPSSSKPTSTQTPSNPTNTQTSSESTTTSVPTSSDTTTSTPSAVEPSSSKTSSTKPSSSSKPASSAPASSSEFTYREVDGGIEITGGWDSDKHNMNLTIPSYIDGKKVVGIGKYAFNCEYIANLSLPDTLTYIDEGAFQSVEMLGEVKIPASVRRIENQAFMGCRMLLRFYIYSKDIFVHHYALPNPYPYGRDNSLTIIAYANVLEELQVYIDTVWEAYTGVLTE